MKISGSQVSAKPVKRLQRLGPSLETLVDVVVVVLAAGVFDGCDFDPGFSSGLKPPFAGLFGSQTLVCGGHFSVDGAAARAVAGATRASESSSAVARRGSVLPGECETTAVIR